MAPDGLRIRRFAGWQDWFPVPIETPKNLPLKSHARKQVGWMRVLGKTA
jgi:hypothetical protein